jgi:hypothetical protein
MSLFKSNPRVAEHGEVFTPSWTVEALLDFVKGETETLAHGEPSTMSNVLREWFAGRRSAKRESKDHCGPTATITAFPSARLQTSRRASRSQRRSGRPERTNPKRIHLGGLADPVTIQPQVIGTTSALHASVFESGMHKALKRSRKN